MLLYIGKLRGGGCIVNTRLGAKRMRLKYGP